MNKRGQGLSTNAIVLIILAVVVLAVVIVGFTVGWSKIAPWLSSNNVDTIKTQCSVACSTGNTFDFCSKKRELNDGEKTVSANCYVLSTNTDYEEYGIAKCAEMKTCGTGDEVDEENTG